MDVDAAKRIVKRMLGPGFAVRRALARELAGGEPEIRLIPLLCREDRDFLDVGANFGVYSYYAKPFCRHVYAMEPNPSLSPHLSRILGSKGSVLSVAASDFSGNARFSIPVHDGRDVDSRSSLQQDANPGFLSRDIMVPVAPIDELGLRDVGVVKIDVEGHEFAVLSGARQTLSSCRPAVIVECEERHNCGAVRRTFEFFSGLGYQPFFIHRGKLRPGSEFKPEEFQSPDLAKPLGSPRSPDYINNFIFLPETSGDMFDRIRKSTLKV